MNPLETTILLCMLVLCPPVLADDKAKTSAPLFTSNDIVNVTIRGPFTTIMRQRSLEDELPATLTYNDAVAGEQTIELGIRTRGRFRHQKSICPWAPLRLNFKKSSAKGTAFAKLKKMKLVTHCRNGSERYSQALLSEYLAYRIFNLVTESSFRVRLMHVTYVDSDKKDRERQELAFLIEHRDQVGKRIGSKVNDANSTRAEFLDGPHTNLGSLFQYLIANTDFSPIKAAEGEPCCHNNVLFGKESGRIRAVPYDFDMTGLVNAPHSAPNPKFRLRNVRQRLYRGRCYNNEHVAASIQAFRDHKQAIYDLIASNDLFSKSNRKQTKRFLDDFYATIEDPKKVDREILGQCIGRPKSG